MQQTTLPPDTNINIPVPPQSEPIQPPEKKNSPIVIIGLVVLILTTFGYAGLKIYSSLLSEPISTSKSMPTKAEPTPTPIVVWQTYQEDKFGFQFQYPSDWQIETNCFYKEGSEGNIFPEYSLETHGEYFFSNVTDTGDAPKTPECLLKQYKNQEVKFMEPKGGLAHISIYNNDARLTLKQFLNKKWQKTEFAAAILPLLNSDLNEVQYGKNRFTNDPENTFPERSYISWYLVNVNKIYRISFYEFVSPGQNIGFVFDQILSSFRFD